MNNESVKKIIGKTTSKFKVYQTVRKHDELTTRSDGQTKLFVELRITGLSIEKL